MRWHRAAWPVIAAVNVLRTIPSLALLAAILPLLGTGFLPSVIALTLETRVIRFSVRRL